MPLIQINKTTEDVLYAAPSSSGRRFSGSTRIFALREAKSPGLCRTGRTSFDDPTGHSQLTRYPRVMAQKLA